MKNILKFFALAATVAVAAISCNKEAETSTPEGQAKFVIRANVPTTKTAITDNGNGTYSPTWNENDAIGVFFNTVSGSPVEFDNTEKDGDIAIFAPKNTLSVTGDQTLYGFYPYGAFNAVAGTSEVRINVKDVQTPAIGSFDKEADLLMAKPYSGNIEEITTAGGIIDLQFARLLSVVKIVPTYTADVAQTLTGEYIKSVKVEYDGVADDEPLAGRVTLNLQNGEFGNWTIKNYAVVANYDDNAYAVESGNSAYLIINPITIAAEKNITFTIKTDKHDISKTVYLDNDVKFPAGNIAKISLSIDDTWTIESNVMSQDVIFMTPFTADITSNTTYKSDTHGNLGAVGTSSETITYTFTGTNQLRNNNNKISAEDGSFYWCTSSTGLVIGGINTGTAQYFKLSFDRKVTSGTATLALSISQDGSHYFPVTATETVSLTGSAVANESYYFSLPEGEHTNLSLKFANSGSGAVIDNVTLTKLAEAGEGNTEVSLEVEAVEPTLVVSPNPVNMLVDGTQQLTVTGTDGEVSYESTNTDVATVSETGLITAKAAGSTTINITTAATTSYKAGSTSVEVTVMENNTNSAESPYSVAEVLALVSGLDSSTELDNIYTKGIISAITTAYNSNYNNISFNISDDGLTTGAQFTIFRISANSADDFKVGDAVEICGTVKNYNGNTPEYTAGASCIAILHRPSFTPDGGSFNTESLSVSITSDSGSSIMYSTGETEPNIAYTEPVVITETTTINAVAELGILKTKVVSATFTKNTGGGDTAEPTLQYTLDGTETGGSNGYATVSEIKQDNINWGVTANTTTNPWRFGGKNLSGADRAAYSVDPISSNITKIEVESGTKTLSAVNSLTISVHDSADDAASGSNAIASKTVTDGIISSTVTMEATDSAWTGKYYRIVYNVNAGSSNQYIQLKEIRFFGFDSK